MKKVLIVGTSHTEATCVRNQGEDVSILYSNRWHDYIDADVTKLARSGCTSQEQLIVIQKYFEDNPDLKFDLAIIEGRGNELNMPTPYVYENIVDWNRDKNKPNLPYYQWWLDHIPDHMLYQPISPLDYTNLKSKTYKKYYDYMLDYTQSFKHIVDNWTANLSMCKFLEAYCNKVKWFTLHNQDWGQRSFEYDLIKDYLIEDTWPHYNIFDYPDEYFCTCRHMNEKGHRYFYDTFIKNVIEKEL